MSQTWSPSCASGVPARGTVVAGRTEEEIYEALGLAWVPPELREDRGEGAAAAAGGDPAALELLAEHAVVGETSFWRHAEGLLAVARRLAPRPGPPGVGPLQPAHRGPHRVPLGVGGVGDLGPAVAGDQEDVVGEVDGTVELDGGRKTFTIVGEIVE